MIIRPAEIYKRAAQRNKLSPELVVSIGEGVFKELMERLLAPKHLAYELDHVGTFGFRHKNFRKKLQKKQRFEPDGVFIQQYANMPELMETFLIAKEQAQRRKHEYKSKEES